jgi:hypothetical protein
MYIGKNRKMRPVETIPGIVGIKENDGRVEFKCDIFDMF